MQEERARYHVKPGGQRIFQHIVNEEPALRAVCRSRADRGGADVAPGDFEGNPGTPSLPQQARGHVAAAGCHIENPQGSLQLSREAANLRPQHTGRTADRVQSRQPRERVPMLDRIDVRFVHQFGDSFAGSQPGQEQQ